MRVAILKEFWGGSLKAMNLNRSDWGYVAMFVFIAVFCVSHLITIYVITH
jgi:hypothetical protein